MSDFKYISFHINEIPASEMPEEELEEELHELQDVQGQIYRRKLEIQAERSRHIEAAQIAGLLNIDKKVFDENPGLLEQLKKAKKDLPEGSVSVETTAATLENKSKG